jgi:hypothetical protein
VTATVRRVGAVAWGAILLSWLVAACGEGDTAAGRASPSPSPTAAGPPATPVAGPTLPPPVNVMGPGPLTAAQVKTLIEDFDARLAQAYAAGDTSHLGDFLAGTELSGNVAQINVFNSRHRRRIFHAVFNSLTITSNSAERVVFNMIDHTTDNHFIDTTTNQVLDQGFPGPAVEAFTIFFDYNPENHTWYWTGAQNNKP